MHINDLKEFYVIDTETTGFSPKNADAIEVSALKVRQENGVFTVCDKIDSYINPGYPLPDNIIEFNRKNNTGIDDEFLSKAPTAYEVSDKIFDFLGLSPVVVGHNVNFDIKFINKIYEEHLYIPFLTEDTLDTLELSKQHIKGSHKLGDVFQLTSKRHSGDNPNFHNSLADCFATLDVLEYIRDT